MPVKIELLDKVTKKTNVYIDEYEDAPTYDDSFSWREGNYSCDCNRAIFSGIHGSDVACGEGRFEVKSWQQYDD